MLPARGVGIIELRGESLTPGYITMGGFVPRRTRTAGMTPVTSAT